MSKEIAEMLYPDITKTRKDIFDLYPKRNLKEGQAVTRFAPSPTGYMHIGNFFQAFISYSLAKNTDGIVFLRIEDTDEKRRVEGALEVLYNILDIFGIKFDEYQTLYGKDIGNYGPYVQAKRKEIYQVFAKELVSKGRAFPCFCKATEGKEEILKLRETKFELDDEKEYDPCRDLTAEQVKERLDNGDKFAIRLKTKNDGSQKIKFFDLLKGELEAKANAKDFVLIKNDGIPVYAFAHAVDDTLMGTTIVVRGEEYIPSTPAHLELFDALDFEPIKYCHNPLICKLNEQGNRRKISKRHDPEANMMFFCENGYPIESVLEYLLNMLSSGFEGWRKQNPYLSWRDFKFSANDITTVAPIMDMVKLNDISKNLIGLMTGEQLYNNWLAWAEEYDKLLADELKSDKAKFVELCKMDREGTNKVRKDIFNYSMMKENFSYIFNPPKNFDIAEEDKEKANDFLTAYANSYSTASSNEEWFNKVKQLASEMGYATDNKLYKENPDQFKGNVAKACEFIRVAITGSKNSPTLFTIMNILGEEEVKSRLSKKF